MASDPFRSFTEAARSGLQLGFVLAFRVGVSKISQPDLLKGLEVKKGEDVVALAAAFRLPNWVEAERVEAEMTLELGNEETLQVKSTLW